MDGLIIHLKLFLLNKRLRRLIRFYKYLQVCRRINNLRILIHLLCIVFYQRAKLHNSRRKLLHLLFDEVGVILITFLNFIQNSSVVFIEECDRVIVVLEDTFVVLGGLHRILLNLPNRIIRIAQRRRLHHLRGRVGRCSQISLLSLIRITLRLLLSRVRLMHRLRYLIVVNLLVCKLHLLLLLCNLFISFLFGVRVVSHLHMIFLLRLTQQLLFILQPVPQILTPLHHLFVLGDVILLMTIKSLNQFSLYAYRHIINNPYCLIQRQLRIK